MEYTYRCIPPPSVAPSSPHRMNVNHLCPSSIIYHESGKVVLECSFGEQEGIKVQLCHHQVHMKPYKFTIDYHFV